MKKTNLIWFLIISFFLVITIPTVNASQIVYGNLYVEHNVSAELYCDDTNCYNLTSLGGGDITAVNTLGDYLYGGATSGAVDLYVNGTELNATIDDRDSDTIYTAGDGLGVAATVFSHNDSSSQASSDNSGRTYIQDILLDTFGHITSIVTAIETVVNTWWTINTNDFINNSNTLELNWTTINSTTDSKLNSYSTTTEIIAFGYYNSSDFVITDYFTKTEITNFGYYNSSDFSISDYFTSAEILAFNYYNSSDFNINDYVTSATLSGYNYYNSSDFSISNYYTKTQVDNFNFYNASDFDINDYATNVKVDSIGNFTAWDKDYNDLINTPTVLSNFTDDLGNRGYSHLSNFTNNLGIGNWTLDKPNYYTSTQTDTEITNANTSMKSYVDATFITQVNEGNLNTNSSDYWDDLGSPSDISTGDLTDDNTFVQVSGDTMTGDLTAPYFNGSFNWTVGDDWNSFDGNVLDFNSSKMSSVYYNATTSNLVAGTLDGGTLDNTRHSDASYDGVTMNFSEASGSPGLDVRVNFTVDSFNRVVFRYKTSELKGSYPVRQVWDYDSSVWTDYHYVGETTSFSVVTQPVFNNEEHVQNGIVQLRLYKASVGNTNNHYYIDWVAMIKGVGTPSGVEVDPLSYHKNEDMDNTGYTITADTFIGNISCKNITGATSNLCTLVDTDTWSNEKSDYWNASLDLDTVIATDEITELKIDFNTVCGTGNHLYVNGNNLACEADDDTTYTNASFDLSQLANTGNVNIGAYNFSVDSPVLFVDSAGNNVGIGTTAPGVKLEIASALGEPAVKSTLKIMNYGIASGGITIANDHNMYIGLDMGTDRQIRFVTGGSWGATAGIGDVSEVRMVIRQDGNVGIGTTTPSQKLEVSGNINSSGNMYASAFYDDGVLLVDTDTNLTEADITAFGFTKDTDTNETTKVNAMISGDCAADNYMYGFLSNGTKKCRADQSGAGAYDLNITNGSVDAVITDSEELGILAGTGITVALSGNDYTITNTETDTDTQLSSEEVQDFAWAAVNGTETHIAVTYQDETESVDFVVSDDWWDAYTDFMGTTTQDKWCKWNGTAIECNVDVVTDTDTNLTEADITGFGFIKTDTNTNCSVDGSCPLIAYDSEINKTYIDAQDVTANTSMKNYVDTQDSAQDECSEITGCVESAWTTLTNMTLNDGLVYIGDGSNNPVARSLSGDGTINNTGYLTLDSTIARDTEIVTANTSMKSYVDTQDSAQDECSEITGCVENAYNAEANLTGLLDDNYAPTGYGDSWNKTYADTLYGSAIDQGVNTTSSPTFAGMIINYTGTDKGLWVYSDIGATADSSLVYLESDNSGFDQAVLYIQQDGVGSGITIRANSGLSPHLNLVEQGSPPSSATEGDIYADTDNELYYYSGGSWSGLIDTDTTIGNCSADNSCIGIVYEVELNKTYVDTEIVSANTSMKTYVDATFSTENTNCSSDGTCPLIVYASNTSWIAENQGYNTTIDMFNAANNNTFYLVSNPSGYITSYTDTNASTACSGTTTYLDGEGNCDDISSVYRANSWDNFTNIPHATPSDNDVTHFSWADEIYDWVISLGYSTTTGTVTNVATGNGLTGGPITSTGTISISASTANATQYSYWNGTHFLVRNDADTDTDTTYSAGNGISVAAEVFSVAGGTALTQDAGGLSVTADEITDTELAFNTGQHLTTTSNVQFNNATINGLHIDKINSTHHKLWS